jgi:hypothetical protein
MARKKKASKKKAGRPAILSVARKAKGGLRGRKPSKRVSTRGRYSKR